MEKKGWFGRLTEKWFQKPEKVLQNYGLMMLYCGYDDSPNPVPEFSYRGRREIKTPQGVSLENLTETELHAHVASWTEWFAGWPVPLDAIPVVKSFAVDMPNGGIGILTSRLPGVARHHAGRNGRTFILRMPTNLVIPVPTWSLSAVEQNYVVLHQIPPECTLGDIPAGTMSALTAIPPFGHLGLPGSIAERTSEENPARFYRDATRQVCLRYQSIIGSGTYDDAGFLSYLEERYAEEKEHIARLIRDGLPESQKPLARLGLLILAAGLFSYGRLEVFEDILDSVPPANLQVGRLAWCLNGMLPLPSQVGDAQRNPEPVRRWVRENQERLKWMEQQGTFVLSD